MFSKIIKKFTYVLGDSASLPYHSAYSSNMHTHVGYFKSK